MSSLRKRLDDITGGMPTFPLQILFLLFFFDEFDTAAFNVLAPNIKAAFHLTDTAFGLLVVTNLTVVLLLAVPVGYYGDRLPRRNLVIAGAIIAGVFSFFTGLAPLIGFLILARLGNGIGRLMNDSIHNSLLSDYYKPFDRPRVFAAHRNAIYVGSIVGSALAGIVAALFGWRFAFVVLIGPIVITALVGATKLKDPVRGGTDDPDAALDLEKEDPVPFREARAIISSVKTLRRQFLAWVFIGAGLIPLAYLLPLFLDRVFGVNELGRGVISALNAAATFAGIQLSGKWTMRWIGESLGEPVKKAGLALVGVGVGLALVAASPWLGLFIVLGMVTSFVAGVFFPPFYATQALVSPARVRTLSFSFGSLFIVVGVWLLYFLPGIAKISDTHGLRWGLFVTVPYWLIGGLVLRSAHRFVTDDVTRSMSQLGLAAELRRSRLERGDESALLTCRGVEVAYGQVQVLFGVDLEVLPGEIVALLGTNGAGKSTLLRAISGTTDPMGGAIFFNGRDITHADPGQTAALGIVQVPGGKAVFPTLTVAEHLRAAGWLYRDDPAHLTESTAEVYELFPRLRERIDQMAGNLSGGEQQMLALGMAFIAKPKLLIIDELSLGLAPTIVEQLLEVVRKIQRSGTAILLVEQSINVALTLAERAYFMEKGEVRFEGPTAELIQRDDIVRSVFLDGAAVAKGEKRSTIAARAERAEEIDARPVVLEVDGLSKRFGGIQAVDDTSFLLREGEILGLIGPNGAGKTTIFDLISGFTKLDSGVISFDGIDVTNHSPDRRASLGLGRSFQDARLVPSLTVSENLALGLERHLDVRDHFASLLSLPGVVRLEEDVAWTVADLVELMHLGAYRDKFVRELSTGSRRIVDLAMCIAHDPKVLLLDEPSSGIAQKETEALGPLLERIQSETGCALLIIEHDMPLITGISDRMIALELGHPIVEGTPHEVTTDARVVSSYLGGDLAVINRSGASAPTDPAPAPKAKPKAKPKTTPKARATATGNGTGANGATRAKPLVAAAEDTR
jgi:ABC-type branched-subunit amino acid transport system ATPase component/predicted MFS family arabinose efflux permease